MMSASDQGQVSLEDLFVRCVRQEHHLRFMVDTNAPETMVQHARERFLLAQQQLKERLLTLVTKTYRFLFELEVEEQTASPCADCVHSLQVRPDSTIVEADEPDYDLDYCAKGIRSADEPIVYDCPHFQCGDWVKWDGKEAFEEAILLRLRDQMKNWDYKELMSKLLGLA